MFWIVSSIHWGLFSSEVPCCPLTAHSTWNRLRFCSDIWLVYLFPFPHDLHMTRLFVNLYFCKFLLLFLFTRTNDPRDAIDRIVRGFFLDTFFFYCVRSAMCIFKCFFFLNMHAFFPIRVLTLSQNKLTSCFSRNQTFLSLTKNIIVSTFVSPNKFIMKYIPCAI